MLAGVAVGVALRTALKFALLLTGLILLLMMTLMNGGFITVDWGAVSHSMENGAEAAGSFMELALRDLSAQLAGFGAGVLMGWKFR